MLGQIVFLHCKFESVNIIVKWVIICFVLLKINTIAQNTELQWLYDIQKSRTEFQNTIYKGLSLSIYPINIALPITYFTIESIKKDKTYFYKTIESIASISSNLMITFGLKYTVNRARPYEQYPYLIPLRKESTPSFPSGHSSMAFNIATHLSLNFPKWYVIVPSFLYASTVAYSRLYLGVHYPTDVLVGSIIGTACAYLNYLWFKNYLYKKRTDTYPLYDNNHY